MKMIRPLLSGALASAVLSNTPFQIKIEYLPVDTPPNHARNIVTQTHNPVRALENYLATHTTTGHRRWQPVLVFDETHVTPGIPPTPAPIIYNLIPVAYRREEKKQYSGEIYLGEGHGLGSWLSRSHSRKRRWNDEPQRIRPNYGREFTRHKPYPLRLC